MIKLIHNNKRAITVVFLFLAVCFMISGVGLDILHGGPASTRHAAKVNDQTFSYADFQRTQERITSRYREMFGPNFATLAQSLNLNIAQQAMDTLVDGAVLTQEAKAIGFTASEESVKRYITSEIFTPDRFPEGFNRETFRSMLQGMGLNYKQFSAQVRDDMARTTLISLLQHAAVSTSKDVESRFERQETSYTITTAEVQTAKLLNEVPTPSEEEQQRYYESHATDYEVPAQVSYEFSALDPKAFEKDVQVMPQDIELFYAENASRFKTPEQVRIRSIKLLFPKEADPTRMAAVTEKANKALEEARQGVPFENLVAKYSDDLPSKLTGGERGWIEKGKGEERFDHVAFATAKGSVSDLIQSDFGYEIVKVEDVKASGTLPLESVKQSIEQEIRASEAPAYAAAKARELSEEAKKSGGDLATAAKEMKLPLSSTAGLVDSSKDPASNLEGLTELVLTLPATDRLTTASLLDVGTSSVVVQVKEYREPITAPLNEVKAKVIAAIKNEAARKLAEQRASEILQAAKADKASFKKEADARKASVVGPLEISRAKADTNQKITPAVRTAAVQAKEPSVLDRVFPSAAGYTVAMVTNIKKISAGASKDSLAKYKEDVQTEASRALLEGTVDLLKTSAELDIDQSLLMTQ